MLTLRGFRDETDQYTDVQLLTRSDPTILKQRGFRDEADEHTDVEILTQLDPTMLQQRDFRDFDSPLRDKQVQEYLNIAQFMAPIRFRLHKPGLEVCIPIWNRARHYIQGLGVMIDPEPNCIPRTRTVAAALISLAAFFFFGGLAIKNPSEAWLPIAYFVAFILDVLIAAFALSDLKLRRKQTLGLFKYRDSFLVQSIAAIAET